ncbi:MAG: hypothetical protein AAB575_01635 [Patescibacteria group bacterium]
MKIKTAHDIGLEELDSRYLHDRKLSRKILALAGFNIQVSEAVIELMSPDSRERRILETLFTDKTLKQVGNSLTEKEFNELLRDHILVHFKDELSEKTQDFFYQTNELVRLLELDLALKLKIDELAPESKPDPDSPAEAIIIEADESIPGRTVVIATEDEINAEKGSMALARQTQTALAHAGPMTFLASPEGQKRLHDIVENKMVGLAEKLIDLPSMADPDEFEKTLQSLAFVMKAEGNRGHFMSAAINTFADRPGRSRKVIAEVMKRYGLNANLMENIVFLCSDRSAPLQIEAINMVVKTMATSASADEIMMAAVTLVKILEEDAKPAVRCRALECLTERSNLILERLPRFLENGRVVPLVKTLLITDPDIYRSKVEALLIAYGDFDSNSIIPELTGDLDDIKNPYVLLSYLTVIESLCPDLQGNNTITIKKWRLCLQNKIQLPKLLAECEKRFQTDLPNSLDIISSIIPQLQPDEQSYFVDLLDRCFISATKSDDTDIAKKIAIYFIKQLLLKSPPDAREITILKTATVVSPFLPLMCHETIWLKMEKRFAVLIQDQNFVEQFIACGGIFFREAVGFAIKIENQTAKAKLLGIVYKKMTAIDESEKHFNEQKDNLVLALREFSTATMLLCGDNGDIPLNLLFDGAIAISKSALANADIVYDLSSGMVVACEAKPSLIERLFKVYKSMEESAWFDNRSLQLFAEAFIRNATVNINVTVEGIKHVCQSPLLTSDLLFKIFIDFQKSIPDPKRFGLQIMEIYQFMAQNPVSRPEVTEHLLQSFMTVVRSNVPPPPDPEGFVPEMDELTRHALTGLVSLVKTNKIDEKKSAFVLKALETIVASRPKKVMTLFQKNIPAQKVPDHYKEALKEFISEFN